MSATRTAFSTPRTARLRVAAGLSWLVLAWPLEPAVAQPIDEVPANMACRSENSRQNLTSPPVLGAPAPRRWRLAQRGVLVTFHGRTPARLGSRRSHRAVEMSPFEGSDLEPLPNTPPVVASRRRGRVAATDRSQLRDRLL